jgi:hypothetical protein
MERVYQQAIELIVKSSLKNTFQQRCHRIVEDTSKMGWGFYDSLSTVYQEAF